MVGGGRGADPARRDRDGARGRRQQRVGPGAELLVPRGDRARLRPDPQCAEPARALPQAPHDHQRHGRRARGSHEARRRSAATTSAPARPSSPSPIPARPKDPTSWSGSRSTRCSRSASGRTRRSRPCSSASRTWTSPAGARTATRACTPTRSAGRRRPSRCPWCGIRASPSTSSSAREAAPNSGPRAGAPTRAYWTSSRAGWTS